jgi:hypothetical protein
VGVKLAALLVILFDFGEKPVDRVSDVFEFLPIDAIARLRPIDRSRNDPYQSQFLQMLGNGRLGKGKAFDNFAANTLGFLRENLEYGYPSRMGKNFADSGKLDFFLDEQMRFAPGHGNPFSLSYNYDNIPSKVSRVK